MADHANDDVGFGGGGNGDFVAVFVGFMLFALYALYALYALWVLPMQYTSGSCRE